MKNQLWSDSERATLKQMWADGQSTAEIGNTLGKNRSAVIGQAHRLKLGLHPSRNGQRAANRKPRVSYAPNNPKTPRPPSYLEHIPIIATSSGVAFMAMKDNLCHAIIGRDNDGDKLARYCGAPAKEDSSYCDHHHKEFHVTPWRHL